MRRLVFAMLLLAIGVGSGWLFGQQQQPAPDPPGLVTGSDIGVRVLGKDRSGRTLGRLMIRQEGEWIDVVVSGPAGIFPLESR